MKTFFCLFLAAVSFLALNSCQKKTDDLLNFPAENEGVKLDFYANFSTSAISSEIIENPLKSGKWVNNIQSGSGIATYMGNFNFSMCCNFCCEGSDCGTYENGQGCFVSEKGDKLYISFSGKAKVYNTPDAHGYAGIMEDEFTVTGGTGSFLNATGQGNFKSFFAPNLTWIDHKITAVLHVFPD